MLQGDIFGLATHVHVICVAKKSRQDTDENGAHSRMENHWHTHPLASSTHFVPVEVWAVASSIDET